MWSALGLAFSLLTSIAAFARSGRSGEHYYAADVYGMTAATHRRYAWVCAVLAAAFAASFFTAWIPVVPLLGICVLLAIFYFSSFLRGFSDEE